MQQWGDGSIVALGKMWRNGWTKADLRIEARLNPKPTDDRSSVRNLDLANLPGTVPQAIANASPTFSIPVVLPLPCRYTWFISSHPFMSLWLSSKLPGIPNLQCSLVNLNPIIPSFMHGQWQGHTTHALHSAARLSFLMSLISCDGK